jgi:hypothetical protein
LIPLSGFLCLQTTEITSPITTKYKKPLNVASQLYLSRHVKNTPSNLTNKKATEKGCQVDKQLFLINAEAA